MAVGIGCSFLLLAFLGMSVPKRLAPLVSLGKISFGLYVFHDACIELAVHVGRDELLTQTSVPFSVWTVDSFNASHIDLFYHILKRLFFVF